MNKMLAPVCLTCLVLGWSGSGNALPENEFACKVETLSLQPGLVMVQANALADAQLIAKEANATRMDGSVEAVKTVLECLPFPQGQFIDYRFQRFVDSVPR